jgi:hypothetical protein
MAVGGSESGTFGARWIGKRWRVTPTLTPPGAQFAGLGGISCPKPSVCIATGAYNASSGRVLTLSQRWDGRRWTILPTPNNAQATESYLGAISCVSVASCTAVGEQHFASGLVQTLAEHWNGRRWIIQQSANPTEGNASLGGVSCTSEWLCIAVGGSDEGTLAEYWDGRRWQLQPTPTPAPGATLSSVACAASSACTAVGFYFTELGGAVLAERWNGQGWTVQPTPLLAGAHDISIPAVACATPLSCIAVGGYENDGPGSVTLAERWLGEARSGSTHRLARGSSRGWPLPTRNAMRADAASRVTVPLPPALAHLEDTAVGR